MKMAMLKLRRAFWYGLAPAMIAVMSVWLLVPPPAASSQAPAWLRPLIASPLTEGTAFFLLYSLLVRYWVPLPGTGTSVRSRRATFVAMTALVLLAGAAFMGRRSLYETYRVLSGSMLPNVLPHDRVVADKRAYGLRLPGVAHAAQSPRRGDVVVFRAPGARQAGSELVKRVIGLPGDQITMRNGHPVINGKIVPWCDAGTYVYPAIEGGTVGRLVVEFLEGQTYLTVHTNQFRPFPGPYTVKPGEVFVLGDNRNQSVDSRWWNQGQGAGVPLQDIEGRVVRLIGSDRNGVTDWSRVWERLGLDVRVPGADPSDLRAGIEKCLKKRPSQD